MQGFRVVGTDPGYLDLMAPAWPWPGLAAAMQAVLGAEVARRTGLDVGAEFAGSHGLGEGGAHHDEHHYQVVGVLAPTGGVIDRWSSPTWPRSGRCTRTMHRPQPRPARMGSPPCCSATAARWRRCLCRVGSTPRMRSKPRRPRWKPPG